MSCDAGICTATAQQAVLNVNDLQNRLASGDVAVKLSEGLPELHVLAYDGRPADRAGGQGRKHG